MSKALEEARKIKNKWSYHIRANSDAMNMADNYETAITETRREAAEMAVKHFEPECKYTETCEECLGHVETIIEQLEQTKIDD